MRLFSLTVARNEADRYFLSMLNAVARLVDQAFVFDDQSDDDNRTVDAARHYGCEVAIRGDDEPSFLQSEGGFRQAAWSAFEALCEPAEGDWVLSLDADEIVAGPNLVQTLRYELPRRAMDGGYDSVVLPIAEVFGVSGGIPQVRTDGYWGSISAPRLFAYHKGGKFMDRKMACGSEPTYVAKCRKLPQEHVGIVHYGYCDQADRLKHYQRYVGAGGHAESHIASILTEPVTKPWTLSGSLLVREAPARVQ